MRLLKFSIIGFFISSVAFYAVMNYLSLQTAALQKQDFDNIAAHSHDVSNQLRREAAALEQLAYREN